jgi:DNA-binding transcriptional LysR family regulator
MKYHDEAGRGSVVTMETLMRRKIPSHSALIAFEAAARHGSFARAADELALTEGAISRQIGRLEVFLGVTLFERVGNRVRLRPNGERYATQVRETLARLERDSRYLMGQPEDGASLEIATLPTFASRWLIPRLKRFQERHPNITVHLAERMEPFVFAGSGFDAALHFEHPAWTGMRTHRLLHEVLVPVCHPSLIVGRDPTTALDALPRLHRRQNPDAWQLYAEETGIRLTNPPIGARYDLHAMLIEAALVGLGVALVPRLYVEADIAEGRLVAPWPEGSSISKTFCLVMPEPMRVSEGPLQAFAAWILSEARASDARFRVEQGGDGF